VLALLLICGGFDIRLGAKAELAEIAQQGEQQIQFVALRFDVESQDEGRIQRLHVAMPDVTQDALAENIRVTARERARFAVLRDRMTLMQVLAQKKRVDFCRVAANNDVLVVVRKDLRLDKITRAEQVTNLPHGRRAGFRHAKMTGDFSEVEALQFA